MSARDLITKLQNLGEENLEREVIIFDGPSYFTPYKVELLKKEDVWTKGLLGKVLID